jgi:hypothetical protein
MNTWRTTNDDLAAGYFPPPRRLTYHNIAPSNVLRLHPARLRNYQIHPIKHLLPLSYVAI